MIEETLVELVKKHFPENEVSTVDGFDCKEVLAHLKKDQSMIKHGLPNYYRCVKEYMAMPDEQTRDGEIKYGVGVIGEAGVKYATNKHRQASGIKIR